MRRLISMGCFLLVACVGCDGPGPADGGTDSGPGPDGGTMDAGPVCEQASDCDDGVFCNGAELCRPGESPNGCLSGTPPCSGDQTCNEDMDRCDSSECPSDPDQRDMDGDGHITMACAGGDDCDDSDGDRYTTNDEVCDAAGHDEDCMDTTLAGESDGDVDGDGFISAMCCNGESCGDDCDDGDINVNPGAAESCNGADDDCSGAADDDGGLCPGGLCAAGTCSFAAWDKTFGGLATGGAPPDQGRAVAVGASGDVFVAGEVSPGTVNFGGGSSTLDQTQLFVLHLLSDGTYDWVYLAPVGLVTPFDIEVDSTGVAYVVGNGSNLEIGGSAPTTGAFIAKLAADGTLDDSLIVPGSAYREGGGDAFTSVAIDGSTLWVTGGISGSFEIGGTAHTATAGASGVIVELDTGLGVTDVRFFDISAPATGSQGVRISDLQTDGSDLVVSGTLSLGTLTLGSHTLVNEDAPADGSTTSAFVARLASDGSPTWVTELESLAILGHVAMEHVAGGRVAVAASGEVALGTWFVGDARVGTDVHRATMESDVGRRTQHAGLALVLEADGSVRWSRSFPTSRYMSSGVYSDVMGVAIDSIGRVYFVGTLEGTADLGGGGATLGGNGFAGVRSGYMTRFSLAGAHSFSARYADQGASTQAISRGPGDSIAITGYFGGTTTFVSAPHVASGGGDVFILRLSSL